jgi:hypothetical protein
MMLPGTHALTIAIAVACIAMASPARPQSHRQSPAPEIEEGRVWPNLTSHGKRSADNALNLLAATPQKAAFLLKCGATSGTDFPLRRTG